jgi:sarcosine oxidase, subunit alpha
VRLPPLPDERIDRAQEVTFAADGDRITGFDGDTIGSAMYASGHRIFSRSVKFHRPRGLLCCSGHCPNCLMTVDGVPNVRVCTEPIREGAVVEAQNVVGTLENDFMSVTDKIGGTFTPVGFHYRTMIRPRKAWPLYEKVLRNAAGLGKLDEKAGRSRRYDTEHRRARVLVIGGGAAGLEAAARAAAEGPGVVLVDEAALAGAPPDRVEAIVPGRALGIWEGGVVPVDTGTLLLRFRAGRIVVATGALEQPLVFPGNDLIGVMLPGAVHRLVNDWSIRPGFRAAILSIDDHGLESAPLLECAGTDVVEIVDLRETPVSEIAAKGRDGRVVSVSVDRRTIPCDVLVMSGGRQPATNLLAQAGAHVELDAARGILVPRDLPEGVEAVGAVTGETDGSGIPSPHYVQSGLGDKCFVCFCQDVTEKDVGRAIREGFDSIELATRYTSATMGPCQGKLCGLASIRLHAQKTRPDEASISTTPARSPWAPVELGLLAGREREPACRTPLAFRHEEAGAKMMWAGPWLMPFAYGDVEGEVQSVHESLGVIDVSFLGKFLVEGPDASSFLDRLYPNPVSDMKPGTIRYGVLTTEGGTIVSDGTFSRLAGDLFYVTATPTGADSMAAWFEARNAVWGYDVDVLDVTGTVAAVTLAGPGSRAALAGLTDADVSGAALSYLDVRNITVADVPCLALRIGFVGELEYELHCPSSAAEHLWDELVHAGARPFGIEAQSVLRLEKSHIAVGQDTNSESDLLSAGLAWLPDPGEEDFAGASAGEEAEEQGPRERLVGFTMEDDFLPLEGAQIVDGDRPVGRVTSVRRSAQVGAIIGLASVPSEWTEPGTRFEIRIDGRLKVARVHAGAFYDPSGERMTG